MFVYDQHHPITTNKILNWLHSAMSWSFDFLFRRCCCKTIDRYVSRLILTQVSVIEVRVGCFDLIFLNMKNFKNLESLIIFFLYLGPNPSYWYLFFQGSRSAKGEGDLAIDDVSFLNCDLPPVNSDPCSSDEFQ